MRKGQLIHVCWFYGNAWPQHDVTPFHNQDISFPVIGKPAPFAGHDTCERNWKRFRFAIAPTSATRSRHNKSGSCAVYFGIEGRQLQPSESKDKHQDETMFQAKDRQDLEVPDLFFVAVWVWTQASLGEHIIIRHSVYWEMRNH
ncbi:uncharacterized protein V6R79_025964 [Siganus canaliculatus]